MARPAALAAALAWCLLLAPAALAWYKQVAGPGAYSVGRAAGLLSGLRGSPYARRSEPPAGAGPGAGAGASPELRSSLRSPVSAAGRGRGRGLGRLGGPGPGPGGPRTGPGEAWGAG